MAKAKWHDYAPPMQNHEVAEAFRSEYGSKGNLMTPHIQKYGKKHQYLYEVSQGTGFSHQKIWGFTVLEIHSDGSITRAYEISQCCHSRSELQRCIEGLGA